MPLSNCPFCSQAPLYFNSHTGCPDGQTRPGNWTCSNAPYVGPGTEGDLGPIWDAAVAGTDPGVMGSRWDPIPPGAPFPSWHMP